MGVNVSRFYPPPMSYSHILAIFCSCAALFGCASTKVETSGSGLKEPLCQAGAERLSVLAYWGPQWRPAALRVSLMGGAPSK
jgi:hypothetical protein